METPIGPPRLKKLFDETLRPNLLETGSFANLFEVPRLKKISVNMGLGPLAQEARYLDAAKDAMASITGRCPVPTKAKKSIAGFKIREGMTLGYRVTLRGVVMYEFLDRLVTVALPRVRDFRGLLTSSFDGRGNYSLGIREHVVFPEIDYDKADRILGMDVSFVTTAKTDEAGKQLLQGFGMPFVGR